MATFLSEDYMTEASEVLGASAEFGQAIAGVELGLQFDLDGREAENPYLGSDLAPVWDRLVSLTRKMKA